MENRTCPICGENLIEERWERASDNKKFHAWRHEDKALAKTNCKDEKTDQPYIDWINEPKSKKIAQNRSNSGTLEYQSVLKGLRELYILNKIIAYKVGLTDRDIAEDLEKLRNKE